MDESASKDLESSPRKDSDENEDERLTHKKAKLCCSARLFITMLSFFAIFNSAYVRVGMSMTLVCMVAPGGKNKTVEFTLSSSTKGYLISAAFYGFLVGPFVAGVLSFKVGGKVVLAISSFGASVTFFLSPEAARVHPFLFFAVRVLTGFFCSFTFPAYYDLVAHWIVPEERQLLVTGALVGIPAASIVNFPISSSICEHCGWVWLFYTFALWLGLWGVIFIFALSDYPQNCRFISGIEVRYIKDRIPHSRVGTIPWKAILKSMPIYAYIVIHFCVNYVYLSLVFSLPMMLKNIHHFKIRENGLLSATPFMGSFIVRMFLSLFFEHLRIKLKLSKNTLRKTFVALGAFLVSAFLLVSTFLSYRYWVLGCFVLASSSLELCLTGGYLLSLLDLCPSYVNVLTGITNAIGNTAGLICPVVSGLITSHQTKHEWNIILYVDISILVVAAVFYIAFGRNHLLYWGLSSLPSEVPVARASLIN